MQAPPGPAVLEPTEAPPRRAHLSYGTTAHPGAGQGSQSAGRRQSPCTAGSQSAADPGTRSGLRKDPALGMRQGPPGALHRPQAVIWSGAASFCIAGGFKFGMPG